ncbi:hypothetical protein THER_1780 [Thermodesulfovibrio sp. N1]|nr:hypothetical protein THER_1780 [Thermodesulfovibrio sp. N1]
MPDVSTIEDSEIIEEKKVVFVYFMAIMFTLFPKIFLKLTIIFSIKVVFPMPLLLLPTPMLKM